jgi:hypothetical protein
MDEPTAWICQAGADREAAERFIADGNGTGRCHAIAKWQQTVEKAIKAIVLGLHEAGILGGGPRPRHEVGRYVDALVRLPRARDNRAIQNLLMGLLDQHTREEIGALDALAPQVPTRRNTEYPFQTESVQWTYPAAEGVFSEQEVKAFRALAYRIFSGAHRVVSALRHRPR